MPDREKVRRQFEEFAAITEPGMPQCVTISAETVRDVLALLKEQEARVMTLEGIEDCDSTMWIEFKSSIYPAIYHDRRGKWLFITRKSQYCLGAEKHYADNYNKTWRVWNLQPTPEQMRDTKWDPPKEENHGSL